jgi:hypothetical protein
MKTIKNEVLRKVAGVRIPTQARRAPDSFNQGFLGVSLELGAWDLDVFSSNLLQPSKGISNLLKHPPPPPRGGIFPFKPFQGIPRYSKAIQAFSRKKRLFIFLWAPQITPNQPADYD